MLFLRLFLLKHESWKPKNTYTNPFQLEYPNKLPFLAQTFISKVHRGPSKLSRIKVDN